jgi:ATP-dependent helicase/nuclease subunit B
MNFLQKTAAEILDTHGDNLSGVTVVLPTHRACYFFRKAMEATGKTIWLPEMITFTDWVKQQSALQAVEPIEQVMMLHKIFLESGGGDDINTFLAQGRALCSDFEEMDLHLVKQDWFFRELRSLASLKVYEPATELNASQIDYLKFWERFQVMYTQLRTQLLAQQKGNIGMMFRKVADDIQLLAEHISNFYFVGFNGLTNSEEFIIKHLHQLGKAKAIWDADEYYVKNNYQEAGLFFRKYFKEWKGDAPQYVLNNITTQEKQISVISVARNMGQVKAAMEIVANRLDITDENASRTAIILPDEKLLMPLQMSLPAKIKHYNITMGLPIARSLAGEFFLLLFRLHELSQRVSKRSKQPKIHYKELLALLRHSYANVFLSKAKCYQLEAAVRSRNIVFVSKKLLNEFTEGESHNLFLAILFQPEKSSEYLKLIEDAANTLIESFYPKKERAIDVEFLNRILSVCKSLQNQLKENEIDSASLRSLFIDELRNARVPFEGEPALGLQIMGLMESRCLDFDNVIILSTNEGTLPAGKSSKSYIPHPLRNEALFSYREKDSITAYLFYRLFHQAKSIYLLYDTEGDRMGGGEPSRYILQLQHELAVNNEAIKFKEEVFSIAPAKQKATEPIVVEKNETIKARLAKNAEQGFSPSALNVYVNCSLQYYFRYVAGLKEPDEVEESMETNTLGTAVHHVFEKLYAEKTGANLTADWLHIIKNDTSRIEQLLIEGFEERFDAESLMQGRNHLQYRLALKMIDMFLEAEIERANTGQVVKILGLEEKLEATIDVLGKQVKVKGTADRIELQNGILSIADYKTGKVGAVSLRQENLETITANPAFAKSFQLLTYAWAYLQSHPEVTLPIHSGIYWLQQPQNGFDSLCIEGNTQLHQQHIDTFEMQLQSLLAELFDEKQPFIQTPDTERCAYCAYKGICKR